jgi:hypothetical protein
MIGYKSPFGEPPGQALVRLEANLDRMAAAAENLCESVQTARNTPETEQAYRRQRTRLLTAVAQAAEALFKAHRLEMSAAAMGDRWRALEAALNEWRGGVC